MLTSGFVHSIGREMECTALSEGIGGQKVRESGKNRIQLRMSVEQKAHDFYEIIKNSLKLMWRRMRKFLGNRAYQRVLRSKQRQQRIGGKRARFRAPSLYLFSHTMILL